MQKFLVNTSGLTKTSSAQVMTIALIVFAVMQPLWGSISDRVGRKPLLIGFGICGTFMAVPIFSALATVQSAGTALALVLLPLTLLARVHLDRRGL